MGTRISREDGLCLSVAVGGAGSPPLSIVFSLRPYQSVAVDQIREAYRQGKRAPIYVAPTGSGKAVTLSFIASNAQAKAKRVIVMVHRQELIRQLSGTLSNFQVPHGIIMASRKPNYDTLTQLASVQTLCRRLESVPAPDLIVIDEAHHAVSNSYRNILSAFPSAQILGVTATPARLDGRGLGDVFDQIVQGPGVADLTSQGFLSPAIYYAPPGAPDTSEISILGGDFKKDELEAAVDTPKITGSAVEHYKRICPGAAAVAFCVSVKHAENVAREFNQAGIRSVYVDGTLSDEDRIEWLNWFKQGRIKVLVSVDLLGEGLDVPGIAAGILLRPTASLSLHLQQIGRTLRPMEGKVRAVILDHVGNCLRHGLADEPREWSLDAKPRRSSKTDEKIFQNRQCPACFRVHPPALACPECGHIYPIQSRNTAEVDGTLEQIEAGRLTEERRKTAERIEVARAQSYGELAAIAKRRGYKPSWAFFRWENHRNRYAKKSTQAQEATLL